MSVHGQYGRGEMIRVTINIETGAVTGSPERMTSEETWHIFCKLFHKTSKALTDVVSMVTGN